MRTFFLSAALLLAIAAGAEANLCSTLSKGGGKKQTLQTCKPFRDGVCDAVTSPPCREKL